MSQTIRYIRLMHESAMISGCLVVVPLLGSGSDRECTGKCWFFFISTKFNGLVCNMEYVM